MPVGQRCGDGPWEGQPLRPAARVATTSAGVAPSDGGHRMCRRLLQIQPSRRGHPPGPATTGRPQCGREGEREWEEEEGGRGGRGEEKGRCVCGGKREEGEGWTSLPRITSGRKSLVDCP